MLIAHLRDVGDHLCVLQSCNLLKAVMVFLSAGASQRRWRPPRLPEAVVSSQSLAPASVLASVAAAATTGNRGNRV
jgi:hypothetical protein